MARIVALVSDALGDTQRRFRLLVVGVLAAYALAIGTGDGDFWPFSKFPMFSRAGRPWRRSFVIEVSPEIAAGPLDEIWEKELPGKAFPLHRHHINQDDLSAVVRSLSPPLDAEQTAFLADYFDRVRHERTLVLYRVYGKFRPDRSVRERFTPLAVIDADGVRNVTPPSPPVEANATGADASAPSNEAGVP